MNIIGIGDNHDHSIMLPKADVLIHTGDFSFLPREVDHSFALQEFSRFAAWMNYQDFKHKIYVPGNHDQFVEKNLSLAKDTLDAHILIDEGYCVPYFGGSKEELIELHIANRMRLVKEGKVVL